MEVGNRTQPADAHLRRLIRSCAAGDRAAMDSLMNQSWAVVHTMCYLVLRDHAKADQCAIDAYVNAWRQARTYEDSAASPRAWLATLAYQEAHTDR